MFISLRIDNRIRIPRGAIPKAVLASLVTECTYANKKKAMLRMRMPKQPWLWKSLPDSETSYRIEDNHDTFARGALNKVRSAFEDAGLQWDELDERLEFDSSQGFIKPNNVLSVPTRPLWPHQQEAVEAMLDREQGLIKAVTGSGKTSSLLAFAARVNQPTLVVMNSTALRDQWKERAEVELNLRSSEIGLLGGGFKVERPFTLAVVNTASKLAEDPGFARRWGTIIVDECHMSAAFAFQKVVDAMPARYRIGASADQRRKDGREYLIHDAFGQVIHSVLKTRMVEEKRVLDVAMRMHRTGFHADWYGKSTHESSDSNTLEFNFLRLINEMASDSERNGLAVRLAVEEAQAGNQVLMFVHLRAHAEMLCAIMGREFGIPSALLLGGNAIAMNESLSGIRSGRVKVGIGTYQAVGTGIDLPQVARGVMVTPCTANRTIFTQARGRICRVASGKQEAVMHVLWDSLTLPKQLDNVLSWNEHVDVSKEGRWERIKKRGIK